jgi:hypothetical protein
MDANTNGTSLEFLKELVPEVREGIRRDGENPICPEILCHVAKLPREYNVKPLVMEAQVHSGWEFLSGTDAMSGCDATFSVANLVGYTRERGDGLNIEAVKSMGESPHSQPLIISHSFVEQTDKGGDL